MFAGLVKGRGKVSQVPFLVIVGPAALVSCSDSRSVNIQLFEQKEGEENPSTKILQPVVPDLITNPGGHLFTELCMQDVGPVDTVLRGVDRMVAFKSLQTLVIQVHSHCAAAGQLGLRGNEVQLTALRWAANVKSLFRELDVFVVQEDHSPCGTKDRLYALLGKI